LGEVAGGAEFVLDGGDGAEFEVGDVSEDGGSAGGDAVLDQKEGEFGEKIVDLDSGTEVERLVAEGSGKIGIDELGFEAGGVAEAEGGVLGDGEVAAAAGASAVTTCGEG
jgi:hypothetical protein